MGPWGDVGIAVSQHQGLFLGEVTASYACMVSGEIRHQRINCTNSTLSRELTTLAKMKHYRERDLLKPNPQQVSDPPFIRGSTCRDLGV